MIESPSVANHEMNPIYVKAVERYFDVIKAYWERTTPTFIVKTRGIGFRQDLMKALSRRSQMS